MPFQYNPPTRTECAICDELLEQNSVQPIIDSHNGRASSANNFRFHNWYNFVLGYSPEFPQYMLDTEKISPGDLVIDPFMGSGTTLVVCKESQIQSKGIDANDFMVDAARTKLNWNLDVQLIRDITSDILSLVQEQSTKFRWDEDSQIPNQLSLFDRNQGNLDYKEFVSARRPEMLKKKYICDKPLAKVRIIEDAINQRLKDKFDTPIYALLNLALLSILVPVSNIRYGPGFGIGKPRPNIDVFRIFEEKITRMIADLECTTLAQRSTKSTVVLGDARNLSEYFEANSATIMITSPPYPGDHEYTKHTRLELIYDGYTTNIKEFREIKKRMLRASTTNIYKDDNDREPIKNLESIRSVTDLIQKRLDDDNATSGFEKLYTKLVWEYFGGMYKSLEECFIVLKPGGKIALLVSDSHAFKMVHIKTAEILQEIGELLGYVNPEIVLWQHKPTTSHRYNLRENILILSKPL